MSSVVRGGRMMLDSLPYIDGGMSDEEQLIVQKMIEEEMRRMGGTEDYLAHLPPPPQMDFPNNPILAKEFQRIKSGMRMEEPDTKRYTPAPPTPEQIENEGEREAWIRQLQHSQAQHNQHAIRIENLMLLETYGPLAWGESNKNLERIKEKILESIEELKQNTQEVNRKRKHSQMEAGGKLGELNQEWHELVQRNIDILQECERITQENKEKQTAAVWDGEMKENGG
eukprot:CAMPEP_0201507490 /NCGR_PEP_ID=MMETSP0161_2-20130828/1142_1 /ASSEMBLY_ACC=CAM_ASM_000251 /TAXON_ID=180227 /ORGANISM="Neoparamoeba aestuarina, Strain SoJaBio B1-5/56/2" /LENGTH=226 /DNA_ID=CAMNT_0047901869 /DNA_START=44 /DNA_END=720 /DNA_ORIENTATION=-